MKTLLAGATLALAATASTAATTYDVDWTLYWGNVALYSGSFEGTDTDGDGVLSYSEITGFTISGASTTDNALIAFGDFDTGTLTWTADGTASGWESFNLFLLYGSDSIGYYYADGTSDSATNLATGNGTRLVITSFTATAAATPVPEPASLAMMGLGALALVAGRRRKTA